MLVSTFDNSSSRLMKGRVAPFVQVLDESMCVIREDICDWLQRYLFSKSDVAALSDAVDLLERLKSGLWLARLAYKLHYKVLATSLPEPKTAEQSTVKGANSRKGQVVTSREHRLYASLRGAGPSSALGQLSAETLPVFPRTLKIASEAPLGPNDVSVFPHTSSRNPANFGVENIAVMRIQSQSPSRSGSVPSRLATDSVAIHWAARDNISAFLTWCRDLGLAETILFETTGLVHRTEEKNVLLTLMDLARIASRFGLCDLPELVKMEREIEALEAKRNQEITVASENCFSAQQLSKSTKASEPQIDRQEYIRRIASNKLLLESAPRNTVSNGVLQSSGDHDNSCNSSLDLTATATDRTFFSDDGTDSGCLDFTPTDAEITPTNFAKPPCVDSGTSVELKSSGDAALQAGGLPSTADAVTSTNRFGWKPVKRSTSLADLNSASTQSAAKRHQGMQSDGGRGDSVLTQTDRISASNAGVGVRSVKRAQMRPLQPIHRSASHTTLPGNSAQHPATNIPVSKLLKGRTRSSSRGPSGPPSKASSGFASRSSSYSDVHREVKKQLAQCTCCNRIHLQRLDEGRYQLGKRIYYMRRFRSHIMVRVGGGWLTLKEFLDRYDPCRQKEGQLIQTKTGTGTAAIGQGEGFPAAPTKLTVPAADLLGSWTSSSELQCSEKRPPLRRSRSQRSKTPVPSGRPKF
ncbi:hypothetical protein AAHC03_013145 [Spirometra sp. Aus1]